MVEIGCYSLNNSFKRFLEKLAAGGCFLIFTFGPILGLTITIYLLLYSNFRVYLFIYLIWIYIFDINKSNTGGRRSEWVCSWLVWKYMKDYFPLSLKKVNGANLDLKRNYMFCTFPHGIFPLSLFSAFLTKWGDFDKLFPNFTAYAITLNINYLIPFYREYVLSIGTCSANAQSIKWVLNRAEGGNVAIISVGGAAEAMFSKPRHYHFVLRNRKGFIKLALQTGSSLVPVISFGEPDLFDQFDNPLLRKFQEKVKKITGFVPIIPIGCGLFQNKFGLIPKRKPVTTVVGVPLDVNKVENPTSEEILNLHKKFTDHLVNFFEENKHKYIDNADEIELVIS